MTGAQIEMVGVGEDDLRVEIFDDVLGYGLDGGSGADGHKHWSLDSAVGQLQLRAATARLRGVFNLKAKGHLALL